MPIAAEYLWLDGYEPIANLRSKTKILSSPVTRLEDLPDWGFDGSSTKQAEGKHSDCRLKPVSFVKDPLRGGNNIIVMCEVLNPDGTPHVSNDRAKVRKLIEQYKSHECLFGIEQEYTLMQHGRPLGWPEVGYPAPQGEYYCGVGMENVLGRQIVEAHMKACLDAGLALSGINAEVMLGQWEFQIGPLDALAVSDQVWMARWLLYRIGEDYGVSATIHPKPVKGTWNGSGAHTNFSTKAMREEGGIKAIEAACEALGHRHEEHIAVYGAYNEERLVGAYEAPSIDHFSYGVSDRGASIRIPMDVAEDGKGYFEDRRPAGSMDPYAVCAILIETVCRDEEKRLSPHTSFSEKLPNKTHHSYTPPHNPPKPHEPKKMSQHHKPVPPAAPPKLHPGIHPRNITSSSNAVSPNTWG